MASPVWRPGSWCGVAYKALFDFVLARNDFDYRTVNVDYGCGIIVKDRTIHTERLFQFSDNSALIDNWFAIRNDDQNAFRFSCKTIQNYCVWSAQKRLFVDLIGTRSNSHDILTWPCRHIANFSRNI